MALPNIKLTLVVMVLSLSGGYHFGYQLIIVNPTELIFKDFLNTSLYSHYGYELTDGVYTIVWAVVLNMLLIGCIIGTFISTQILTKIGRKPCFIMAVIISSMGCIFGAMSYYINSWELFAIGRLIMGISLGITFCLQPLYFTEISPDDCRGFLNGMTGCLIEIGFGLGSIIALPILLGTATLWPWLYWLELIPNLIALIVLPFLVESPKFLMANKNDLNGARESLKFFKHKHIDKEIKIIEKEIQIEQHSMNLILLLKKPYLRKGLLISVLNQVAVQFSGIGALSMFSTQIFEQAGVSANNANYGTVAVSLQCTISAIIGSFIVDRVGRRPLLLTAFVVMDIINVVFLIFFSMDTVWAGYICIAGAVLFSFMFGVGPGIVQCFIMAELMPQNAKSAAVTCTMFVQWITLFLSTLIYLPLTSVAGSYSFFMFIIPLTIVTVYFFFVFPETKNKSIIDIIAMLGYKPKDIFEDYRLTDNSINNSIKKNDKEIISSVSLNADSKIKN